MIIKLNRLPSHFFCIGLPDWRCCHLLPQSYTPLTLNHLFFECLQLALLRQAHYFNLLAHHLPNSFTAFNIISLHNIHTSHLVSFFISCLPPEITPAPNKNDQIKTDVYKSIAIKIAWTVTITQVMWPENIEEKWQEWKKKKKEN